MNHCRSTPLPNLGSRLGTVLRPAPLYKVDPGNKSLIAMLPKTPDSPEPALSTYAWLIDSSGRCKNSLFTDNEKLVVYFDVVSSFNPGAFESALIRIYYRHIDPTIESVRVRVHVAGNPFDRVSEWTPVKNGGKSSSVFLDYILVPEYKTDQCIIRDIQFRNTIKMMIQLDTDNVQQNAFLTTKKMYDNKLFADVKICVKKTGIDGVIVEKQIMVHRAVIAARSSVFEAMLQSICVEKQRSVIEITDFEPRIVEELLKYLYVGKVDLEYNAVHLLKIADKYDIPELMSTCEEYIAQHIPKFSWNCVFELLNLYSGRVPVLRENVKQYFVRYETTLKKSPDFKAAIVLFPDMFFDIYLS